MSGIFETIASVENLLVSWREFRRGKRATPEVQVFERDLEDHVFRLHEELVSRVYHHGPYTRFVIQDPKRRVIHKARVEDRLVHHAVARILQPIFERSFIHDSYSCRKGKGPHAAVRRLEAFSRRVSRNFSRPCWALKFDVRKFFDSVDHDILLCLLAEKNSCSSTRQLLAEIVRSYHVVAALGGGGDLAENSARRTGIPIGSMTSQLFANIYLDALDHYSKERLGVRHYLPLHGRYASSPPRSRSAAPVSCAHA